MKWIFSDLRKREILSSNNYYFLLYVAIFFVIYVLQKSWNILKSSLNFILLKQPQDLKF